MIGQRYGTFMTEANEIRGLLETETSASSNSSIIPLEYEYLVAAFAEYRQSYSKTWAILRSVSGIMSTVASSILIWMILRSYKKLTVTYHRLLFGLCISDIILSLSFSTFNLMTPSDVDYMVWNARGNQATCNTLGFFNVLGGSCGIFYNCALNIYYVAVVRFEKSEEYIRSKVEPFLHGVPIAAALAYSITLLVTDHYNNNNDGVCVDPLYEPPHCIGYDDGEVRDGFDIPCGRGRGGSAGANIVRITWIVISPAVISISLGVIYRAVVRQEQKMARYGVGALRANLNLNQNQNQDSAAVTTHSEAVEGNGNGDDNGSNDRASSRSARIKRLFKSLMPLRSSGGSGGGGTRAATSQSRAVMYKAFAYSLAWLLSWGIYITIFLCQLFLGDKSFPMALAYLANMFIPLQGFWNMIIFLYPRVIAKKRSRHRGGSGNLPTWCEALVLALRSRGVRNRADQAAAARTRRRTPPRNVHTHARTAVSTNVLSNVQSETEPIVRRHAGIAHNKELRPA